MTTRKDVPVLDGPKLAADLQHAAEETVPYDRSLFAIHLDENGHPKPPREFIDVDYSQLEQRIVASITPSIEPVADPQVPPGEIHMIAHPLPTVRRVVARPSMSLALAAMAILGGGVDVPDSLVDTRRMLRQTADKDRYGYPSEHAPSGSRTQMHHFNNELRNAKSFTSAKTVDELRSKQIAKMKRRAEAAARASKK